MRRTRLSILAGTAVALVMAAATTAGANPIYPSAAERTPSRDMGSRSDSARPESVFPPSDATTRARAVAPRPTLATQQPDARIISTPNVPAAPAEPVNAPLRMVAPAPVQTVAPQQPATPAIVPPALAPPAIAPPAPATPVATPAIPAPPAAAPVVSEPVRAAPSFAASDSEIADKVRELIAKKQLERLAPRKNERDAIEAQYVKNRRNDELKKIVQLRPMAIEHAECARHHIPTGRAGLRR